MAIRTIFKNINLFPMSFLRLPALADRKGSLSFSRLNLTTRVRKVIVNVHAHALLHFYADERTKIERLSG